VGACDAGVRLGLAWLAWLGDLKARRADALSLTAGFPKLHGVGNFAKKLPLLQCVVVRKVRRRL